MHNLVLLFQNLLLYEAVDETLRPCAGDLLLQPLIEATKAVWTVIKSAGRGISESKDQHSAVHKIISKEQDFVLQQYSTRGSHVVSHEY